MQHSHLVKDFGEEYHLMDSGIMGKILFLEHLLGIMGKFPFKVYFLMIIKFLEGLHRHNIKNTI